MDSLPFLACSPLHTPVAKESPQVKRCGSWRWETTGRSKTVHSCPGAQAGKEHVIQDANSVQEGPSATLERTSGKHGGCELGEGLVKWRASTKAWCGEGTQHL